MPRPITLYYAATVVFVLLDFLVGVNIRVAFLEPFPTARLLYYGFCYACLALMLWRPAWAIAIGVAESLVCVIALTLSIAVRVLVVTDEMIETGRGYVSMEELGNYVIVGGIAYFSYVQGIRLLKVKNRG